MSVTTPRPPKTILADAIAEIREREQRLLGAAAEARRLAQQLEELAGDTAPVRVHASGATGETPALPKSESAPEPAMTAIEQQQAVMASLAESQPAAVGELARATAITVDRVRNLLGRLRDEGSVRMVGSRGSARWWTTHGLDQYVAEHGCLPDGSAA